MAGSIGSQADDAVVLGLVFFIDWNGLLIFEGRKNDGMRLLKGSRSDGPGRQERLCVPCSSTGTNPAGTGMQLP